MQVTVLGASGKVGRLVVAEALARGHSVVAFVHRQNPFGAQSRLSVVKGDVYQLADVAKALRGSQAAISCLGSWGTPKRNVLTAAMRAVIPAMAEQKIDRIITLTGSGAKPLADKSGLLHDVTMAVLGPFPAGKVFRDGEDHMRLLADSPLAWTTLRSPVMTSRGGAGYTLADKAGNPLTTIPRRAVARALVDQLEDTAWLKQAPVIIRKK